MSMQVAVQGETGGSVSVPKGGDTTLNVFFLDDKGEPVDLTAPAISEVWLWSTAIRTGSVTKKLPVTPVEAQSGYGTILVPDDDTALVAGTTYFGFARWVATTGSFTAATLLTNDTNIVLHPTIAFTADYGSGLNVTFSVEAASATISAAGTGYTLGDTLTHNDVGGSGSPDATFTVTGVSGGLVTSVSVATGGTYTAIVAGDSSANAVTGGTGAGCKLNVKWKVKTVTLVSGGLGYIDIPSMIVTNASTLTISLTLSPLTKLLSSNYILVAVI
jgi:hypothetical protein